MLRGRAQFDGSKKARRLREAEDRVVGREQRNIRRVRALAHKLQSRYQLDAVLTKISDEKLREGVKTMILSLRPDLASGVR